MFRKLLTAAAALMMAPAFAQICPISNNTTDEGIGDGCSTRYEGVEFEWLHHEIAVYNSVFKPACDKHDKCWTQLGTDYSACDGQFLTDMKNRCDSKFNKYLMPAENLHCKAVANNYKDAVTLYRTNLKPEQPTAFQIEARNRSLLLEASVNGDVCGTNPQGTTLYAPALITQVNSAFQTSAGRLPTIYEFLRAVNSSNIATDRTAWTTSLYNIAAAAAGVTPPSVGWVKTHPTMYSYTFTASPNVAGVSYLWKVMQITGSGPSLTLTFRPPEQSWAPQMHGFLRATNGAGVKNMAVIETSGWLIGTSCSPSGPPVPCD
jgi:hypothetical protein